MDKKQRVFAYIEEHKQDVVNFMMELVKRPSVNCGDGIHGDEKEMQDYFAQSLREEAFNEVHSLAFDTQKNRPNIIGMRKGLGGGRSLIFNGHSDVVPVAFPKRWICDPFVPVEIEGKVYGRGTSDMKGGLAGAFYALKAIAQCGYQLKGDVMIHSVVGEESQSAETFGTAKVIQSGYTADFAICCEPTDLEVHIASSALVFFKLIVEGKGVHISARNQMLYPQCGCLPSGNVVAVDAFRKSMPLIDYLFRLETEWNHRYRDPVMGCGGKPFHDKQGVGVFTINPSEIKGGEYLGTIPSHMEYTFGVWYPDQLVSRDELLDEIRRGVAAIASTDDWLREHQPIVEGPVIQDWPGFRVDAQHSGVVALANAAEEATGEAAILSGFKAVCDAYYLNKLGIPSVILGPGSISNSVHGDNEFIYVDDLIKATKIYAAFVMDWCGVAEGEGQ